MARGLSFIPVPLQSVDGHSLLEAEGTFWELSPWMPGAADRSRAPGSARIAAAFGALATFHRALEFERVRAPSAGLIHRCKLLQNLDRGGLSALRGAIENAEDDSPERRDLARQWLSKSHSVLVRLIEPLNRAACEPLLLQPCLRDARGDHLLFTDDRLTAIVDFGAMGVDCVATDLARLMGDWLPADGNARSDALAAYDRIRPLDPAEIAVLDAFESSADLLIGESWLRWHYLEKQRFSDPRGAIEGIRRGVARLERRAFEMGSS
jgi:Ser/Thr protein kinase RdoA (MazF antagonist)